jgi:hypothetical protein
MLPISVALQATLHCAGHGKATLMSFRIVPKKCPLAVIGCS